MTPAERLQAAIEKLETANGHSIVGPWQVEDDQWTRILDRDGEQVLGEVWDFDAHLIVILKATVPALLGILRDGYRALSTPLGGMYQDPSGFWRELALADSILDGEQ